MARSTYVYIAIDNLLHTPIVGATVKRELLWALQEYAKQSYRVYRLRDGIPYQEWFSGNDITEQIHIELVEYEKL